MEEWLPRNTQIVMVEAFAPAVAIDALRSDMEGANILLLVDAEAVEGALVRGYSSREDLCELAGLFWSLACELDIGVYVDRVPTDGNPSDGPSRGRPEELAALGSREHAKPPSAQLLRRGLWTKVR